jgi:hypothetical protein
MLRDVEAPTFSRQPVHRWQWGCQPCALGALYRRKVHEVEPTPSHSEAERIRSIWNSIDLIGNQPRDIPTCSIVPQSTTLPRAPKTEKDVYEQTWVGRVYNIFLQHRVRSFYDLYVKKEKTDQRKTNRSFAYVDIAYSNRFRAFSDVKCTPTFSCVLKGSCPAHSGTMHPSHLLHSLLCRFLI